MGIEPTSEAWEALNKTLKAIDQAAFSLPSNDLSWKLDGNWRSHRLRGVVRIYAIVKGHRTGRLPCCLGRTITDSNNSVHFV